MTGKRLKEYQKRGMLVMLTAEEARDLSDLNCDILNYQKAKTLCEAHGNGKLSCWNFPLNYWSY